MGRIGRSWRIKRINLEQQKYAARIAVEDEALRHLGPQASSSMKLKEDYDPMLRKMVFTLQTHIYKTKLGEETKRVRIEEDVPVSIGSWRYLFVLLGIVCGAMTLTLFINGLLGFALVSTLITMGFLSLWYSIPSKARIDEEVEIKGLYWHEFPDNQIVYPDNLGNPVILVDVGEPEIIEGDKDVL